MEFCSHLRAHEPPFIEKPLPSADFASLVDLWYAEFIDLDKEILFELIMAANHLNIQPLLQLASAKVAALVKNKSIQ